MFTIFLFFRIIAIMSTTKTISVRLTEKDRERFRTACQQVEIDEAVVSRALVRAWTLSVEQLGHSTFPIAVIPTKDLEELKANQK